MPAMSYGSPGCQPREFDVRGEDREIHRERRRSLLSPECLFEYLVPAVDANAVTWNVGWGEEGKPHDVVPMHVGHEDVIGLRRCRAVARHHLLAERPHTRAEVAQHILGAAGFDLDARGVSAVGAGDGQAKAVDIGTELVIRGERAPGRIAQCPDHLVADCGRGQRDGQRSARAPEPDALHLAAAS